MKKILIIIMSIFVMDKTIAEDQIHLVISEISSAEIKLNIRNSGKESVTFEMISENQLGFARFEILNENSWELIKIERTRVLTGQKMIINSNSSRDVCFRLAELKTALKVGSIIRMSVYDAEKLQWYPSKQFIYRISEANGVQDK